MKKYLGVKAPRTTPHLEYFDGEMDSRLAETSATVTTKLSPFAGCGRDRSPRFVAANEKRAQIEALCQAAGNRYRIGGIPVGRMRFFSRACSAKHSHRGRLALDGDGMEVR